MTRPIYHLTEVDERRRCVAACVRVLKRGGLAAFAYINKYFALPFQVLQDRKFLDREYMRRLLDCGTVASTDRYCGWTDCHYCMPEEVEGLALEAGLHIDAHIATDGIGILLRDMVDAFDKEQFAVWVDYHLKTCREPSLLGYSNHGLLICRKA